MSQQSVLVDICNTDKYRFGFNGQEKVNEWAGIGNHNTAEFREYDTRTARRLNIDPVDQIRISNYAVNGLNPIVFSDPNGDLFGIKGFGSSSEQRRAARNFAAETGGEVKGLLSSSIHVEVTKYQYVGNENFDGGYLDRSYSQYFHNDGSQQSRNGEIGNYRPSTTQKWAENKGFLGKATYSFADAFYVTGQNLFTKNFRSDDMAFHIGGSVTTPSENMDAFITSASSFVPVGGMEVAFARNATVGRVFWSGGRDVAGNAAMTFAKETGQITLEMTTNGQVLETVSKVIPYRYTKSLWNMASRNFARGAKGEVNLFTIPSGPSSTSIWLNIEKPILEQNGVKIITNIVD